MKIYRWQSVSDLSGSRKMRRQKVEGRLTLRVRLLIANGEFGSNPVSWKGKWCVCMVGNQRVEIYGRGIVECMHTRVTRMPQEGGGTS